ncbi:hypothetical protein [Acerihabitans arboris]|uniref:Uncharacterized protein n=1 Tax=Acerihabitans arboris TaxID=2691583 RepID=A0A845SRS5_9GAMM|nr:hypothetical protein [Acerihabitans arboris]NDL65241.1 hypothetical protein [Acerihabitans arboris]
MNNNYAGLKNFTCDHSSTYRQGETYASSINSPHCWGAASRRRSPAFPYGRGEPSSINSSAIPYNHGGPASINAHALFLAKPVQNTPLAPSSSVKTPCGAASASPARQSAPAKPTPTAPGKINNDPRRNPPKRGKQMPSPGPLRRSLPGQILNTSRLNNTPTVSGRFTILRVADDCHGGGVLPSDEPPPYSKHDPLAKKHGNIFLDCLSFCCHDE